MANNDGKSKQIILIRNDLNLSNGKLAAQVAHASVSAFLNREKSDDLPANNQLILNLSEADCEWLTHRFTKICLGVKDEQELIHYYNEAKKMGLKCSLIKDAGFTELEQPTYTTVGIGPDFNEKINVLTGNLKRYNK